MKDKSSTKLVLKNVSHSYGTVNVLHDLNIEVRLVK